MKKILLLTLCVIYFFNINAETQEEQKSPTKEQWVTILVHGIISVKSHLNLSNVVRFVRDNISDTTYARSIEKTRKDPFFFQHHPMQGLGLHKIDSNQPKPGAASCAYAQLFDLIESYSNTCRENSYYTFGWSGLLSPRMRYLEAKIFYDHMLKEFEPLFNDSKRPKIRIIGYSHGGNIALRLAEVYKREGYDKTKKITIDELILIGVPVLPETDYVINCSLFKKVYHFYSYGDRIQRLDFFSLDRVFSNRKFHERTDFAIPDKLVQINIKIKRPAKIQKKQINTTIEYLMHHRSTIRNSDPGHTELWSFGWSPASYRKNFPLNPLPFTIFAPYIVEYLKDSLPDAQNLMVELHPSYERMLFYNYEKKCEQITPFLSTMQLSQLKNHAEQFRPIGFTATTYNAKISSAIYNARKERFDQWNKKKCKQIQKKCY